MKGDFYPLARLCDVGIALLDCEHRTPKPAIAGYPYIAIPDIQDGRLRLDNVRLITRDDLLSWTRKTKPQAGDVIVTRRGRVGDTAVVPAGLECAIGQNLVILRSTGQRLDQSYLRWALRGPQYRQQVEKYLNVGAVFDSLNCADIPKFEIPVPPLEEQRAIASLLGALDDKIELNRRMNKTLEAIARTIYKSWFVSRVADAQWSERTVGDLIDISRSGLNPSLFPDEVFEHYSIPAYDGGRVPVREQGSLIKSNKFVISPGSVLISKLNPRIPRTWLVPNLTDTRAIASTEFLVTIPRPPLTQEYLYCLFMMPAFVDEFASRVTGTSGSHQRVKPSDVLSMTVEIPDGAAVDQLTCILKPLFERVKVSLDESQTLASLRDSLLPKLIYGELRVGNAEQAVGMAV